jgi:hypothetical protein
MIQVVDSASRSGAVSQSNPVENSAEEQKQNDVEMPPAILSGDQINRNNSDGVANENRPSLPRNIAGAPNANEGNYQQISDFIASL